MKHYNNDDGRDTDRIDIGIEGQSEDLNEIEAISISEIELGKLDYFIILNLKQKVMI